MNPDDRSGELELTFLLGLAFQLLIAEFNDRIREAGYPDLRPVHGLAFQALGPSGATSTELAARLGVTKQAAGQIVDHLEERGYLERRPHPAGGRRKLVVLTPKGLDHLQAAGDLLRRLEAEIGEHLGEEALADLRGRLADLIGAMNEGPLPPLRPVW